MIFTGFTVKETCKTRKIMIIFRLIFYVCYQASQSWYYRIGHFSLDSYQLLIFWKSSLIFSRSAFLKRFDLAKIGEDLHRTKSCTETNQKWLLLWYKRKAGNHYKYCLSSIVNFVMHWLDSALCLVSHFHYQFKCLIFCKLF